MVICMAKCRLSTFGLARAQASRDQTCFHVRLARGPVFRQHSPDHGYGGSRLRIGWGQNRPRARCRGAPGRGSRWPRPRARSSAVAARPSPDDPASSMCDPCRETYAKAEGRRAALRSRRAAAAPGPGPSRSRWRRSRPSGRRPPGCAPTTRPGWARSRTRRVPCAVPGCKRTLGVLAARAADRGRARDRAAAADPALRAVRGRVPQAEGSRRSAAASTAATTSGTGRRSSRSRPTRRGCPTIRRAGCATSARPTSARSPIARCAAGRRAARRPGPGRASDQLDACLAGKPTPKAPHRMCESCNAIYRTLQDVERPCRRSGCKGTWLDKRGGQLARAVRGKTGDPYPQYCEDCSKNIVELEDRQLPCKTENCTGTWTWAKAAQLAAGVRPELKERARHRGRSGARRARRRTWRRHARAWRRGVLPEAAASRGAARARRSASA